MHCLGTDKGTIAGTIEVLLGAGVCTVKVLLRQCSAKVL